MNFSKNKFYIVIFTVIIAVSLWACISTAFITRAFRKDMADNKLNNRRIAVEDLLLTETKNGEKYWEIYADRGYYEDNDKIADVENAIGNFYEKGEVVASFQSPRATVNSETQEIIMYDRSKLMYKDYTSIQADKFTYKGKDLPVEATGHVVIKKPNEAYITGDEAILTDEMTNFKIMGNVNTKIYDKGKTK